MPTSNLEKIPRKLVCSIAEACEVVDVGRTTIYEEIREGHLIARKARGRTIILIRDLERWLSALPRVSPIATAPRAPHDRPIAQPKPSATSDTAAAAPPTPILSPRANRAGST